MAFNKSDKTYTPDEMKHTFVTGNSPEVTNDTTENLKSGISSITVNQTSDNAHKTDPINPTSITNKALAEDKSLPKKISILVDENDPCLKKDAKDETESQYRRTVGMDPRFQEQNQTVRCWVMYTDFHRCERILEKGSETCAWFKQVYTTICPTTWTDYWDELRTTGRLSWHKYKTQGDFPGDKYGV